MPRQARKTSGTGIYHVMLRGINRQDIFEDDEDYMKFLQSLHQLVECYDECGYRMRAGFRQLARITGISYGIIQRVATDQRSPLIYEAPSYKQFVNNMQEKMEDQEFTNDMQSLLRPGISFSASDAYPLIYETFIDKMEGKRE